MLILSHLQMSFSQKIKSFLINSSSLTLLILSWQPSSSLSLSLSLSMRPAIFLINQNISNLLIKMVFLNSHLVKNRKNNIQTKKQSFSNSLFTELKMISRNILTEKTNESKRTEPVQKSQRFLNTQKNQPKQDDDNASNFYQKSNTLANNKITIRRCVSNKAMIRPNSIQQRQVNQAARVKIVPAALNFQSVQSHQMYEIPFFIRNQSTELQKVRIIPPLKKQFKIKYNQNFENQIAAGLAVKISVMFCSEQSFEMAQDRIIVMGNSFKHQVQLTAHCPRAVFQIPKIINLNSIFIKQQKQILIPVTNSGQKPGILSIEDIKTTQYCPHISYPTKSITILPNKQEYLELLVKPVTLGQTQINISFSNMEKCAIKCLVVEDMVDIVDQQGNKILIKDFCEVFLNLI